MACRRPSGSLPVQWPGHCPVALDWDSRYIFAHKNSFLAGPRACQWGPGPLQGPGQPCASPLLQGWLHRTGRPWPGPGLRPVICCHGPSWPDSLEHCTGALTLAGLTEALTRAGLLSQIDFKLVCRLSLCQKSEQMIIESGGDWQRRHRAWDPGHCKVPASRLPQAVGLARDTMHQERLLTRKVASQTDDMYNRISIFIHMHILCYMDLHNAIMTQQTFMYIST